MDTEIEKLMRLVEAYRTSGGSEEHAARKDHLMNALEELLESRDELGADKERYFRLYNTACIELQDMKREPQKARPDFIAGYDAGMADAKRMQTLAGAEKDYRENIKVDQEPVKKAYKFPKRKVTFEFGWEKRVPIFAIGFASPSELVCILWPIKFCIALRY